VSVRVRFAPSPTGTLHPGTARTVLFNYLFARHHGGSLVLRIEDTDRSRADESSLQSILGGIRWLGLTWDEGPEVGGPYAPYVQSERLQHYQEAAGRLIAGGHAYRCFCTPARLEQLREEQRKAGKPTRYDRLCLTRSPADVEARLAAGEPFVIRMLVPEGTTVVRDLLREPLQFENASQDDQVLIKSDGYPTYHLASTVDDHLMEISHVIRGDEWIASSPKQVMLYQMLGWEPPAFAHLPLVLGPDKAKLSKRHGAVSVLEYREEGYLPEAMVNFLAFLGWSPGTEEEFFSLEHLCAAFDLDKVQVSPAVFDKDKLDSVNGHHIRALAPDAFVRQLRPFVKDLDDQLLSRAAPLVQERIKRLAEADALLHFLVEAPSDLPAELVPKGQDAAATSAVLQAARAIFATQEVGPPLEPALRDLATSQGCKFRDLLMTLRIALTGSRVTPPLLESAALLGRDECLRRIDHAIDIVLSPPATPG